MRKERQLIPETKALQIQSNQGLVQINWLFTLFYWAFCPVHPAEFAVLLHVATNIEIVKTTFDIHERHCIQCESVGWLFGAGTTVTVPVGVRTVRKVWLRDTFLFIPVCVLYVVAVYIRATDRFARECARVFCIFLLVTGEFPKRVKTISAPIEHHS